MEKYEKILVERSAYRQAGYILMHLLTHYRFKSSVIRFDINSESIYHENIDSLKNNEGILNDNVIMCLRAGPLSEKNFCLQESVIYDSDMTGDDLWQISRLFFDEKYHPTDFEKHLQRLDKETEELLKEHWDFVVIIAGKFIQGNDLTVKEINRLWGEFITS